MVKIKLDKSGESDKMTPMKNQALQKSLNAFLIFALLLSTAGCARIPYHSASNKPVTANPTPEGYKFVQHISESNYQFHLFWGIFSFKVPGQEGVFSKYINNGDAITNVRTKQQREIIGWLASNFTWGIVFLTHTEFEGDLVKKG